VKDLRTEILEHRVKARTADLEEAQLEILERLALAAEFRDDETGQHTQRVGRTAAILARALDLPSEQVKLIQGGAPLHDMGKLGIPDEILRKPGKLTVEEFEVMKTHTTIGAQILSGSRFPILQKAEEIALTHHERWDGTGYAGLAGERIPLSGRIVALADVFDALTNDRVYRKAMPLEEALAEIELQRGRHFDPEMVDAFLQIIRPLLSEEASLLRRVG
jgi:putative two-component system response regulator